MLYTSSPAKMAFMDCSPFLGRLRPRCSIRRSYCVGGQPAFIDTFDLTVGCAASRSTARRWADLRPRLRIGCFVVSHSHTVAVQSCSSAEFPKLPLLVTPNDKADMHMLDLGAVIIVAFIASGIFLVKSIYLIREYERGVALRLGKYVGEKPPGIRFAPYPLVQIVIVDMREFTRDCLPQTISTRDGHRLTLVVSVQFCVVEPRKAILEVENFPGAIRELVESTLHSLVREHRQNDVLHSLETFNEKLRAAVSSHARRWGVEVRGTMIREEQPVGAAA